jgi:hypothetical protein
MKVKNILLLALSAMVLGSCDIMEPMDDNHTTDNRFVEPSFSEGLLLVGYSRMPNISSWKLNEVATDDAVSNVKTNNYTLMAGGQWSSTFDPVAQWSSSMLAINYLNQFLGMVDSVRWHEVADMNRLFVYRLKGEAFALRGIHRYFALCDVAGKVDGQMTGIQIINQFLDENSDYNIPRETFDNTVKAIETDFDSAAYYLPEYYKDLTAATDIPAKYGNVTLTQYNTVMGHSFVQRVQGRIVKCYRAMLRLLAASPAYNESAAATNDTKWEAAAEAAATALNGISMNRTGNRFFEASMVNSVPLLDANDNEMAWRTQNQNNNNTLEKSVFPPSLNGNGDVNPTQNFVDAFPTKNGYPITDSRSGYDPTNPFNNRDPRLDRTVVRDFVKFKNKDIITYAGTGSLDQLDSLSTSTRTGYYLKKLIREDVNFNNDGTSNTQKHYYVFVRYTEMFLDYAEAANEVGGPDYKVAGFSMSARDVIKNIRARAGISPDNYISTITTQEEMRQLIRNERRLELSFEGHRFDDLRRWNLLDKLNEPIHGMKVTKDKTYTDFVLTDEKRSYASVYGPLPQQDVLRFSNLKQNDGWK